MIEDETSNSLKELFDEDGNLVTDSTVEVSAGSAEDEEA